MAETRQISVAKCTEEELDDVSNFLSDLKNVLKENENYDTDDYDVNQEIADAARKLPYRAFIVPVNLGILLDNYQDIESRIIEHPKWIKNMFELLKEVNTQLSENNVIKSGSELHLKIQNLLQEE
jgi:hypothetical protein